MLAATALLAAWSLAPGLTPQAGAAPLENPEAPPAPIAPPPAASPPDGGLAPDDWDTPDSNEVSVGEIPTIETIELTADIAKRALDSYIAAKEKYVNSDFDQFENLQDFVDQTDDGKKFEADIKAAGFANVSDWNLAITTLGLTYSSVIDDQSADLQLQIQEVEEDPQLAQDMKDTMIKALKSLIPSENNRKVIEGLMDDPVYGDRLKLLDIEEE
ncbi:MAG: hypothetical protein ACKOED_00655 [Aestuariivirga sp.]|uniref:hypothetical protein n=1 Tax=Aestuariivirga sp. TaxID=2650926 RepID=UPI0038D098FD